MRTGSSLPSIIRASALLVAIAVSATSCITTSSYMKSWVGKSETELLANWGAPDSSRKLDDGRVIHTWRTIWGGRDKVHTCRQTFAISANGEVESSAYNGCARLQPKW
jgi:hypothetical protein